VVAGTELKTYRYDSSRQGIDGQWRDAATAVNYFSRIAGHDAWAMVAARLGNRASQPRCFREGLLVQQRLEHAERAEAARRAPPGLAERRGEFPPRAFPGKNPFCRTIRGFTLHHPAPGRIAGSREGGR
jgi:hypothetical protein